ncbi:MAG TPA: hypothetical protein VFZ89_08715 [Solirubrobacteraceae bacterium]
MAALASGVPSTLWTLASRGSLLDGALAAGSIVLRDERRPLPLLVAAVPVHLGLSFGWAAVLAVALPHRATVPAAAVAGLGIAALDLGLIGRRLPRIAALPQPPQWADHVAFGLAVGVVVRARRRARGARSRTTRGRYASARSTERVS